MLVIGVVANIAQYVMSGFFFIGYSGIVVGLVGFIWVRQRKAPWEGYPLQRSVIFFLLFFILAMMGLQIFGWALEFFNINDLSAHIANTAHIVGGLVGMTLGQLSFFARKKSV
jgi:GlpG protein